MARDRVTEELREHLITVHAETGEDLDAMIAEMREDPQHPARTATDSWIYRYIHERQHSSLDWDAGHDEEDV